MLTREHRKLINKVEDYIELALDKSRKLEIVQEKLKECEYYSAKTNPVLQAQYGLDDEQPLSMYDCLIPAIKKSQHANPYDCFEIDVIANWHRLAQENDELKQVIENYKKT